MQRQSYNARRLDRLKAELKKAGNTPEIFNHMLDYYELEPLEAQELSEQVRWPPKVIPTPPAPVPTMVVKRFTPPEPPPKLVIKRY